MFEQHGWWWPDGETFLPAELAKMNLPDRDGALTYQQHKYQAALALLPLTRRRTAIDVGAHVGLWSRYMSRDFVRLMAFEPLPAHADCWWKNVPDHTHAWLYPYALGSRAGLRQMVTPPGHTGGAYISTIPETGVAVVDQRLLDAFQFVDVDLLKIDVEGYELFVIGGALDTILRCRPVIILEQSPTGGQPRYSVPLTGAVDCLLRECGMVVATQLGSDFILRFP